MSTQSDLAALYGRELDRLAEDVRAYEKESDLWTVRGAQKNTPGNLAMHLCGNLQAYIGAELGGTGYVRDRPNEFAGKMSRDEILSLIAETREVVTTTLEGLSDEVMESEFANAPEVFRPIGTRRFLLHLLWHFGWHKGHIYYHRLGGL